MADPPRQPTAPTQHIWVRFCRWLWRHRGFMWGTVVLGVVLNLFASFLSTPAGSTFSNTPLGAIFGHPLLSALIGLGLLVLTAGLWLINRLHPAPVSQYAPARPITQHDRDAFVHLLRREYSKRLTQSLQGTAIMVLGLHERTDITGSSAQLVFRRTDIAPESPFPSGTSLTQVYDDTGQGLLLLGAPGAGKTTLLLDLARELLARAESDPAQPPPVILNLSSWASKKLPLTTWLVDQLRLVYGLPPYLGQALLDQDRLTLLLDGLDEVEAFARSRCIETINAFRGEHFVRLVVCSRSQEYLTQEARLQLSSAVEVQPLQEREVMDYLKRIGKPLAAVRAALRTNPVLKQLLTTPLMLSVVILAYRDTAVKDLPTLGSVEEQQRQIFARYVERMLEQRATIKRRFTPQQTRQWLTWLAQQMQQQHLTEFYLEQLQLTWLSTQWMRSLFPWINVMIVCLIVGPLEWLFFSSIPGVEPIVTLLFGLLSALAVWLFSRLPHLPYRELLNEFHDWLLAILSLPEDEIHWSWKRPPRALLGKLLVFPSRLFGKLLSSNIQPVDEIHWSWKRSPRTLLGWLLVCLLWGLFSALVVRLADWLVAWLVPWLHKRGVGLLDWVPVGSIHQLTYNVMPTLWSTLLIGLLIGLLFGLTKTHTTAALLFEEVGAREMGTLKNLAQIQTGLKICGDLL